jgi:putative transposase
MARLPRFVIPGQPQHVIVRGINREPLFYTREDYLFYLEKLKSACEKYECQLHAYVLMTNHVHLLLTPKTEVGIGKVIQSVGRYYVQYFNYLNKRTGTLWEGRYKATLVDSENYLLTCYRYLELNPVRASMVNHPLEYPWSSYHYNAKGEANDRVTPHQVYLRLGATSEERQQRYRILFKSHLSKQTLDEIRESTNKAWVLGDSRFKEKIKKKLNRRAAPLLRGGDRKSVEYLDSIQ